MGKYLHYFSTKADYIKKYFSNEYKKHWTSLTTPGYKSNYDRTKKKLALTPLTLVPLTNNSTTFTFAIGAKVNTNVLQSISYSTDGGITWTKTNNVDGTAVNITVTVTNKQPVMFIGEGDAISVSESVYSKITANQNFAAFGNPLSLLSQRYRLNSLLDHPFALSHLFSTAGKLVYADGLILSAKKCGNNCYSRMFENCYLLETFPELPAVSLANYCYYYMFQNCYKMVTPPVLSSTKLGTYCYANMFEGCSGLTSVPELPAMNLTQYCYNNMFRSCTGLTNPTIILPAINMASYCYSNMFNGCNKLISVPELPSTSLAPYCYDGMFNGCSKLNTAPSLPATTLEANCYQYMFYNCTSLITPPVLPALTLKAGCYQYMFQNCSSLTSCPALPAMTLPGSCYYNMFTNCTSITTMPDLPAKTITGAAVYRGMFAGCTNLVNVVDILPAETLSQSNVYYDMFNGCTSMTTAPKLPAKATVSSCYYRMFYGCTNLNHITALFDTVPNTSSATANWVSGVASTGTFTMSTTTEWDPDDYRNVNGIPEGWTVNKIIPTLSTNDGKVTYDVPSSGTQITIVGTDLIADYTFTLNDPDEVFTVTESNLDNTYNVTCSDHTVLHTATLTFSSPGAVNLTLTLINNIGTIPNTYKRVSYVEADGNQQVDLNLNMFGTVPVDYGVQFMGYLNSTSVQYASLLANTKETSPYYGTAIRKADTNNNVQYRANQTNTVISTTNKVFIVNYTGTENNAFDCKTTLFGAINTTNGSWWRPAIGRIYVCKIIINNTVVRNLLPCVEISTDTAGLYDTVNNVFYTSETEPLTYVD